MRVSQFPKHPPAAAVATASHMSKSRAVPARVTQAALEAPFCQRIVHALRIFDLHALKHADDGHEEEEQEHIKGGGKARNEPANRQPRSLRPPHCARIARLIMPWPFPRERER